jgi:two-component system chemotaxis sensor kinase CheA
MPVIADKDAEALADELSMLGKIEKTKSAEGNWVFILDTAEPIDDVVAICAFIVNVADLKISQAVDPARAPMKSAAMVSSIISSPRKSANAPRATASSITRPPSKTRSASRATASLLPSCRWTSAPRSRSDALSQPQPGGNGRNGGNGRACRGRKEGGQGGAGQGPESSSIRVSIEKVDQLINLVGELVITQAMIEQRVGKLDPMRTSTCSTASAS